MIKFGEVLRGGVDTEREKGQVENLIRMVGDSKFLDIEKETRLKILADILKTQRQFREHHNHRNPDNTVTYAINDNDIKLFELSEKIIDELAEAFDEGLDEVAAEMLLIRDSMDDSEVEDINNYTAAIQTRIKNRPMSN